MQCGEGEWVLSGDVLLGSMSSGWRAHLAMQSKDMLTSSSKAETSTETPAPASRVVGFSFSSFKSQLIWLILVEAFMALSD